MGDTFQPSVEVPSSGKCNYCQIGYTRIVTDGEDDKCIENTTDLLENCLTYELSTDGLKSKCALCGPGFSSEEGVCEENTDSRVENCMIYEKKHYCLVCNEGYSPSDGYGLCNLNDVECQWSPWDESYCDLCNWSNGYDSISITDTYHNQNCVKKRPSILDFIFPPALVNCKTQSGTTCKICEDGFVNFYGKCNLSECPRGFTADSDNICSKCDCTATEITDVQCCPTGTSLDSGVCTYPKENLSL